MNDEHPRDETLRLLFVEDERLYLDQNIADCRRWLRIFLVWAVAYGVIAWFFIPHYGQFMAQFQLDHSGWELAAYNEAMPAYIRWGGYGFTILSILTISGFFWTLVRVVDLKVLQHEYQDFKAFLARYNRK